jgi:hypothetical protein
VGAEESLGENASAPSERFAASTDTQGAALPHAVDSASRITSGSDSDRVLCSSRRQARQRPQRGGRPQLRMASRLNGSSPPTGRRAAGFRGR